MHIIWSILIGFVAGLIAKAITPGAGPGGFFLTAALGIGGSLAATYLGQLLGWYQPGQSAGFVGAIIGQLTQGGTVPATITPDQASKLTPEQVQVIASHAEQHNPGIVDEMSGFYAQHAGLIKTLGGAALTIALAKMAERH